ncbi:MAG: CehA/McbA family metallohydrolase [Bacillota bacterium]
MSKYYLFELHCHTDHSDGEMSPQELVERAVKRGYYGIAITDHNTISAVDEVIKEGKKRGLKVIPGIEWTTFFGHIVALGKPSDIDWRDIRPDNIDAVIKKAYKQGLILTLAHPKRYGTPICTGCYMDLPITKYEYISAYEVWTQKCPNFSDYNEKAIKEYDEILARGYKMAAVYGYDWHKPDLKDKSYAVTFLGDKENVYDCIRKGDTYVSIGLLADIKVNNKHIPFGSEMPLGEYDFDIKIKCYDEEFCKKYGIAPQKIILKGNAVEDGEKVYSLEDEIKINLRQGYIRIEIIGEEKGCKEKKLLLTSPYYITKGD